MNKEWRLSLFPVPCLFWALSAMCLIPTGGYPTTLLFIYCTLGVFLTFQYNRENRDIAYMMGLPIRKRDMVKARFGLVVSIEGIQWLLCIPMLALHRLYLPLDRAGVFVGANLTLLAFGACLMGVFNLLFLPGFYRTASKIGVPFLLACSAQVLLLAAGMGFLGVIGYAPLPALAWINGTDPGDLLRQLPLLLAGIAVYAGATALAYRLSVRRFEQLDL